MRVTTLARGAFLLGVLWTATPTQAADPAAVRVTVTSRQHSVAAPGRLDWTLRITNRTARAMSGLQLGESVVLNGDPGHGATSPFTSGGCTAAAGTTYCPLPTLGPGETVSRPGFAQVPLRFDTTGPSNVGSRVETLELVIDKNGNGVSNQARLVVPVTRAALPYTGVPLSDLAHVALLCLAGGGALLVGAASGSRRSCPRTCATSTRSRRPLSSR